MNSKCLSLSQNLLLSFKPINPATYSTALPTCIHTTFNSWCLLESFIKIKQTNINFQFQRQIHHLSSSLIQKLKNQIISNPSWNPGSFSFQMCLQTSTLPTSKFIPCTMGRMICWRSKTCHIISSIFSTLSSLS